MKFQIPIFAALLLVATPLALGQNNLPQSRPQPPASQPRQSEPPGTNRPSTPLTGTHWTLTQLNGEAVKPQTGHNEAYIELAADTQRLSGSGGCNRLMGSYELDGTNLHFRQVASTMMACSGDVMPREQAFVKALGDTASFRIRGSTLLLRGKDDSVLARLSAESAKPAAPAP
jgi:heat shock protein HslJ